MWNNHFIVHYSQERQILWKHGIGHLRVIWHVASLPSGFLEVLKKNKIWWKLNKFFVSAAEILQKKALGQRASLKDVGG